MVNFFGFLKRIKSQYFVLIASICHPNPKYFPEKGQLELCHQRYQANLHFFLLAAVICTAHLFIKKAPIMTYIMSLWICFSLVFLKILCCRLHPEFFKVFSNIFIGIYGLTLVWSDLTGVHRAWIATPLLQTVVLFCTGSTTHFLFQAVFQQILVNTVYQKNMIKTVEYLTPEEFVRSLTSVSTSLGVTNIVVTFCVFAALQNANERILAAEKKKEEFERQKIFLLGFSHELRNSINSLMGNVKLASLERISEKAQKFLQIADICGELLLHLINNILDTSKAQIGDLEINPEQTNIYDAMERIWSVCSEIIRRKNLQGRFVICTNMPKFLQVDHYRLMQVFLNVIGNAVKFTDRGEINVSVDWIEDTEKVTDKSFEPYPFDDNENDISEGIFEKNQTFSCIDENFLTLNSSTIRVERKMLKHSKNTNQGILKVTVSDTGCGISKDNIDKLFQQFSQVSLDPSQRKLGTGLGLFITKELCERMGGDIKVFSKESTGSCFSFCLPMTPVSLITSHGQNTEDSISSPRRQKSLKAMIVDDESFSQGILKNFFDRLQIDVVSIAENGLEAYTKYCDYIESYNSPVVVTMDLTMPVMDGKKSAQKIRKFEQEKGIRPCLLIVISGNCSESEIAQCLDKKGAIRANAFLKKPARPDDISRVISQYMARDDLGEH